jgi:serine/threonine protein kinase
MCVAYPRHRGSAIYSIAVSATTDKTNPAPSLAASGAPGAELTGQLLGKRYRIERVVGIGGMGSVYSATDLNTTAKVAVKVLKPEAAGQYETVERFFREARAAVAIDSAHVVKVLDVGETRRNGLPYMVMEYLEGEDLGAVIQRRRKLPIDEVADFVIQACIGLSKAHSLGIVHRDIKPSNLWIAKGTGGVALLKILDFGISKTDAGSGVDERLTATTSVFGSPSYMSPEQVRSAKNVDLRTDIWGLGTVLYECLTGGRLPFEGDNAGAVFAAIIADPPQSIRLFRPDVPEAFEAIVLAALQKPRDARIGSASELAHRLAPFASARTLEMLEAAALDRFPAGREHAHSGEFRTGPDGSGRFQAVPAAEANAFSDPASRRAETNASIPPLRPPQVSISDGPMLSPPTPVPLSVPIVQPPSAPSNPALGVTSSFGGKAPEKRASGLLYVIGGSLVGAIVGAALLGGLYYSLTHSKTEGSVPPAASAPAISAPVSAAPVSTPAPTPTAPSAVSVPSAAPEPSVSATPSAKPAGKPPATKPTAKPTTSPTLPKRTTPAQIANQLFPMKK